jgi:hypothetical protein
MENEHVVAVSIENVMVDCVVLYQRDAHGKDQQLLFVLSENAHQENLEMKNNEFVVTLQELVLEDIAKPKRNLVLLSDLLHPKRIVNAKLSPSNLENVNEQDVANGPPNVSTRDART